MDRRSTRRDDAGLGRSQRFAVGPGRNKKVPAAVIAPWAWRETAPRPSGEGFPPAVVVCLGAAASSPASGEKSGSAPLGETVVRGVTVLPEEAPSGSCSLAVVTTWRRRAAEAGGSSCACSTHSHAGHEVTEARGASCPPRVRRREQDRSVSTCGPAPSSRRASRRLPRATAALLHLWRARLPGRAEGMAGQ